MNFNGFELGCTFSLLLTLDFLTSCQRKINIPIRPTSSAATMVQLPRPHYNVFHAEAVGYRSDCNTQDPPPGFQPTCSFPPYPRGSDCILLHRTSRRASSECVDGNGVVYHPRLDRWFPGNIALNLTGAGTLVIVRKCALPESFCIGLQDDLAAALRSAITSAKGLFSVKSIGRCSIFYAALGLIPDKMCTPEPLSPGPSSFSSSFTRTVTADGCESDGLASPVATSSSSANVVEIFDPDEERTRRKHEVVSGEKRAAREISSDEDSEEEIVRKAKLRPNRRVRKPKLRPPVLPTRLSVFPTLHIIIDLLMFCYA